VAHQVKTASLTGSQFYNASRAYLSILEQRSEVNYREILGAIRAYAQGGTALDYGCGVGMLSMLLAKQGFVVTGIDISTMFIERAQKSFPESPLITFGVIDGLPLPYDDASYDVIASSSVLEHCTEIDSLLLEFRRLLKSNGLLFIETPNMLSPLAQLKLMARRLILRRKSFHRYATPAFFCRSLYYITKKMLIRRPEFIYVKPNYETFAEADEDVTYLSNPLDYLFFLRSSGFDVLELSRSSGFLKAIVSKYLPFLAGGVMIVARKK
jgi:2-polyprenyl-3-methyl-5-hydroxy-6-metoxy-1,4-benzoquinol methylase